VYRENPVLWAFMEHAARLLSDHPVNLSRIAAGKRPANAVWLWGQGRAPRMPTLKERFGLTGAVISAVDLLKGIGVYAGLDAIDVPGATGYLDTNYEGKVAAALDALRGGDFVYVHIEAPDEASHEGSLEKKIQAIEAFDERVVGPLSEGAREFEPVSMLIVSDHLTPVSMRTHTAEPAPFLLIEDLHAARTAADSGLSYDERTARASGWRFESAVELFTLFAGRKD
jgi:2,3-bisphosphoglycerate-independent phosphoglycerate mutase